MPNKMVTPFYNVLWLGDITGVEVTRKT